MYYHNTLPFEYEFIIMIQVILRITLDVHILWGYDDKISKTFIIFYRVGCVNTTHGL